MTDSAPPNGARTGRELLWLAAIVAVVGLVLWLVVGDAWTAFFPSPESAPK